MTDRALTPYELDEKRRVEAIHRAAALKMATRVRASRRLAQQADLMLRSATVRELMASVAARQARTQDGGAE